MKLLLFPILAAIILPTAVSAETWYLLAKHKDGFYQVPMKSKENSETEGTKFIDLKSNEHWRGYRASFPAYICIKGR